MTEIFQIAWLDLSQAVKRRSVWISLAKEDIGDQHRRTALGPFWLMINYLLFAGTFIFVFHRGETETPDYAAYVATGLLVWFYIMETISRSVALFSREESFIKGTTLPVSVYVMRLTMETLIRSVYALIGCLAILMLSGVPVTPAWSWSVLGVLLILVATPAVIIQFAFLGAWFPDSQFIVSNLMRVGMFLTPVFWVHTVGTSGIHGAAYYWNPFTYFLEIVRVPILAAEFPARSFVLCLAMTLVFWLAALLLLGKYRRQIVFML